LIKFKGEGEYWDFKKKWHINKAELLLDIICMANNLADHDGYLIIGIEDKTMKISGVEKDKNRKELSHLSQFIKGKNFSVYHPEIDLQTIILENHCVDVIIVKNTNKTPYYLLTDFSDETDIDGKKKKVTVAHGRIYARVNDRKSGVDRALPFEAIEYLWRKRFGLEKSILERYNIYLDEREEWNLDLDRRKYGFHMKHPEFQIVRDEGTHSGWEPQAAFYNHNELHFTNLYLKYHSTTIYETELWFFDEYRIMLPKPKNACIEGVQNFWYSYYSLDEIEGKLLNIFTHGTFILTTQGYKQSIFLIFKDLVDRLDFEQYFKQNHLNQDISKLEKKYEHEIKIDSEYGGRVYSSFHVALANELYEEWKNSKL
jgi:hypothetical protein